MNPLEGAPHWETTRRRSGRRSVDRSSLSDVEMRPRWGASFFGGRLGDTSDCGSSPHARESRPARGMTPGGTTREPLTSGGQSRRCYYRHHMLFSTSGSHCLPTCDSMPFGGETFQGSYSSANARSRDLAAHSMKSSRAFDLDCQESGDSLPTFFGRRQQP